MTKEGISFEAVLQDLEARFLTYLPPDEINTPERLFFHIEQCHWFYEDFYVDNHPHLRSFNLKDFSGEFFSRSSLLLPYHDQYLEFMKSFIEYKSQIPVYGCIMLNPQLDKLVLVQNWKKTSWSFPRGKINEGESPARCAVREVYEECGCDICDLGFIPENLQSISCTVGQHRVELFIVAGVPEETYFTPIARKEVWQVKWFGFNSLPKKNWCVLPFMSPLKKWIAKNSKMKRSSTPPLTKQRDDSRSPSVAQQRASSVGKARSGKKLGGKGNEQSRYDTSNHDTFGNSTKNWSVDDMFSTAEKMSGMHFTYDGNPQNFGDPSFSAGVQNTLKQQEALIFTEKGPLEVLSKTKKEENTNSAPFKHQLQENCNASSLHPSIVKNESNIFGEFSFNAADIDLGI
jgi:mRNA-decapping enzyme subunit 2